jgi:hypothetical protein
MRSLAGSLSFEERDKEVRGAPHVAIDVGAREQIVRLQHILRFLVDRALAMQYPGAHVAGERG